MEFHLYDLTCKCIHIGTMTNAIANAALLHFNGKFYSWSKIQDGHANFIECEDEPIVYLTDYLPKDLDTGE